jgi:hypothetical protein
MDSIDNPRATEPESARGAGPGARGPCRFSQLSAPCQALVRLCQAVNHGSIRNIRVKDAEPIFTPPPLVLIDIKLDSDEIARPELNLSDFALRDEVKRLMNRLGQLTNGRIERIEVQAGVPRRVVIERRLTEARL